MSFASITRFFSHIESFFHDISLRLKRCNAGRKGIETEDASFDFHGSENGNLRGRLYVQDIGRGTKPGENRRRQNLLENMFRLE